MRTKCVWPSGDSKPICQLTLCYKDFIENFGLVFEESSDDLDTYYATHFIDGSIGLVVLLQYKNAPVPGIVIYVDSWVNTSLAISIIAEKFSLSDSMLKWKSDVD